MAAVPPRAMVVPSRLRSSSIRCLPFGETRKLGIHNINDLTSGGWLKKNDPLVERGRRFSDGRVFSAVPGLLEPNLSAKHVQSHLSGYLFWLPFISRLPGR